MDIRERAATRSAAAASFWRASTMTMWDDEPAGAGEGATTSYSYEAVSGLSQLVQNPIARSYDLTLGFRCARASTPAFLFAAPRSRRAGGQRSATATIPPRGCRSWCRTRPGRPASAWRSLRRQGSRRYTRPSARLCWGREQSAAQSETRLHLQSLYFRACFQARIVQITVVERPCR